MGHWQLLGLHVPINSAILVLAVFHPVGLMSRGRDYSISMMNFLIKHIFALPDELRGSV